MRATHDLNVAQIEPLISPAELKNELPISSTVAETVSEAREQIRAILRGDDRRLLVIVGPCSIHNKEVALDYARRLQELRARVSEHLHLVMRVYFEKPRTTIGWRGFLVDPRVDGGFDIVHGLREARSLLLQINELGLPVATELLDPIVPQYLADLLSWAAVGARTSESQTHREMASGLSMPVGFKNTTEGNLQVAIDALASARSPHAFLGIDQEGRSSVVHTRGNDAVHVILRGSRSGPNFSPRQIKEAVGQLQAAHIDPLLMVDCSHGNSQKKYKNQEPVFKSLISQRRQGAPIMGLMLESNIHEGSQPILEDPQQLRYGVSITDECISWETTERLLLSAAELRSEELLVNR